MEMGLENASDATQILSTTNDAEGVTLATPSSSGFIGCRRMGHSERWRPEENTEYSAIATRTSRWANTGRPKQRYLPRYASFSNAFIGLPMRIRVLGCMMVTQQTSKKNPRVQSPAEQCGRRTRLAVRWQPLGQGVGREDASAKCDRV